MNHLNGNNNQTNKPNISITTNFQFNQSQPPHSAPLQSIQNYLSHYDTDGTTEPMSAAIQNTSAHSLNQNTLSQMTNELQRDLSFQQKDDLGQMIFYPSSYGFNSLKSLTDLPRRKRYKPSNDQVSQLMEFFEKDPLPSTASRIELSSRINMRPRAIQVWFQNRRAKVKSMEKERKLVTEYMNLEGQSDNNLVNIGIQYNTSNVSHTNSFDRMHISDRYSQYHSITQQECNSQPADENEPHYPSGVEQEPLVDQYQNNHQLQQFQQLQKQKQLQKQEKLQSQQQQQQKQQKEQIQQQLQMSIQQGKEQIQQHQQMSIQQEKEQIQQQQQQKEQTQLQLQQQQKEQIQLQLQHHHQQIEQQHQQIEQHQRQNEQKQLQHQQQIQEQDTREEVNEQEYEQGYNLQLQQEQSEQQEQSHQEHNEVNQQEYEYQQDHKKQEQQHHQQHQQQEQHQEQEQRDHKRRQQQEQEQQEHQQQQYHQQQEQRDHKRRQQKQYPQPFVKYEHLQIKENTFGNNQHPTPQPTHRQKERQRPNFYESAPQPLQDHFFEPHSQSHYKQNERSQFKPQFLKSSVCPPQFSTSSLPSPMTSPLNTLMQLQALQQSMQASWMRSQNVNRSEPEFAGQISSMMPSEHTNEGYSAEELLKFLEM